MQHNPGPHGDPAGDNANANALGGDGSDIELETLISPLLLMDGGLAVRAVGELAAAPDATQVTLPPLNIIASCKTLGFYKPLDCFWSEVKADSEHYMREQFPCTCADFRRIGSRWSGLRASGTINVFIHRCLFNEHDSASIYRMGQCPACNTIYWTCEDAPKHHQQAA